VSDAIARRNRDLGDFVSGLPLSGYHTRFAGHFRLERHDGVLTIHAHRDGQAALWSRGLLNAWNLLLAEAGADRDNELIVITGTGDSWLAGVEASSFTQPVSEWDSDLIDEQYNDGVKVLERLVFDIDVPTIAVINGPGPRLELPLLCDLTLCAPDVVFGDGNFRAGSVPGDGMYLVLRELAGAKRASHAVYTGQGITAGEAQRLGIVNEVLPRGDLMPRALDLATQIMARPRTARRLTHGLITRTWQHRLVAELRDSYARQLLVMTTRPGNDSRIPDRPQLHCRISGRSPLMTPPGHAKPLRQPRSDANTLKSRAISGEAASRQRLKPLG
jgi:enoyl-CoA hydratase/carnithine racemase